MRRTLLLLIISVAPAASAALPSLKRWRRPPANLEALGNATARLRLPQTLTIVLARLPQPRLLARRVYGPVLALVRFKFPVGTILLEGIGRQSHPHQVRPVWVQPG